jgi:hypothetical protein
MAVRVSDIGHSAESRGIVNRGDFHWFYVGHNDRDFTTGVKHGS